MSRCERPGRAGGSEEGDPPRPVAGWGRVGFTLTELMVGIVVTGLLGAVVVGMLLSQNDFYRRTEGLIFAEESLRATAELAPSELRMASGRDVVTSKADSVRVRLTVLTGVVCAVSGQEVDFFVVEGVEGANLPPSRGTAHRDPFATSWTYADGFEATGSPSSVARTNCESRGSPRNLASGRYRRVTWSGPTPSRGASLRVYGFLTYHFRPSSFARGLALWRNSQELAGPFAAEDAGFQYRVCPAGGGCSWRSEVATGSPDQHGIRSLRIRATALGSGSDRHDVAQDLRYEVALRN